MMMDGAAASPGRGNKKDETISRLWAMHKAGIFSKEEVREMVFKHVGVSALRTAPMTPPAVRPTVSPKLRESESVNRPVARDVFPDKGKNDKKNESKMKVKKKPEKKNPVKKNPDGDVVVNLREIVKNVARRRFFEQCTIPSSILWYETTGGKNALRRMLFEKACEDCFDELYRLEPVKLRKINQKKLEIAIHWQVMRDRNNWRGKFPKRAPYTGNKMDFDFKAALDTIDRALNDVQPWQDLTGDGLTESDRKPPKPECDEKKEFKEVNEEPDKQTGNCLHCRVNVWTGAKEECPKVMGPAHPIGTDWQMNPNAQPYCSTCWTDEKKFLDKMGSKHRAVGRKVKIRDNAVGAAQTAATAPPQSKRQKTKKKSKSKKTQVKKTQTKKSKTKKSKKQLEVQEPEPPKTAVLRWQVCTNTVNTNIYVLTLFTSYLYDRLATESMRDIPTGDTTARSLQRPIVTALTTSTF